METHSSVLAWRIPGTAEPGGLPSMGSHRVEHDWSDLAAAAAAAAPHRASWKVAAFARFGPCHHCQADSVLTYLLRMLWWLSTHHDLLQTLCSVGCSLCLPTCHLELYLPGLCSYSRSASPPHLQSLAGSASTAHASSSSLYTPSGWAHLLHQLQHPSNTSGPGPISEPQLPKLCQFPTGQSTPCPMGQLPKIQLIMKDRWVLKYITRCQNSTSTNHLLLAKGEIYLYNGELWWPPP